MKNLETKLYIFEPTGVDRFRNEIFPLLKMCDGVVFVFDLTRPETLAETSDDWISFAIKNRPNNQLMFLLGNKTDEVRNVSQEVKLFECSKWT